jgi:hypothetical protein
MAGDLDRALDCTTQEELRECSDDQIRTGIARMEDMIYVVECFGVRDLILLEWLYREAERRELE